MMFAPLEGWRHVKVTDRHTAVDYAHVLKRIWLTLRFAKAKKIVLMEDNLNTHKPASLYEAFSLRLKPAELDNRAILSGTTRPSTVAGCKFG